MADKKPITIVVNGTEHNVSSDVVTFTEVVDIAFPGHPNNPDVVFSVTFEKAQSKPHEGTLAAGQSVTVKQHGTIFDVTQTNRS